jgi:hypothetical protein
MIAVLPGDDLREVEQVMWLNGRFEVFLKFEEANSVKMLKRAGWKVSK